MQFDLAEKVDFALPEKQNFYFGLGWATKADLDLILIVMKNGKLTAASDIIYHQNRSHPAISLSEDVLDGGDDDGDDESAVLNVNNLDDDQSVAILVNIHSAGQRFGMVNNAYIRICDGADEESPELRKYTLNNAGVADAIAVEFGRVVKEGNLWTFKPSGAEIPGVDGKVSPIANKYGAGFAPAAAA